jgi:hypothetical protein
MAIGKRMTFFLHDAGTRHMLKLDIDQALHFLDMLDHGGRHTIASEAPFGGKDDGPRWMGGATFEANQRDWLFEDIQDRQDRGWNVYYGLNRPYSVLKQQGSRGKCNVEDIIAVRALAFDIDITKRPFDNKLLLDFVDKEFTEALRPSLVISTGGGFQLVYLLKEAIGVQLFRPTPDLSPGDEDENEQVKANRSAITKLVHEYETLLRSTVPSALKEHIKIDNMSNLDRVMRLPGTVNFPKAEKIAKGQRPALAHIAVDYQCKCDIYALRGKVPRLEAPPVRRASAYVHRPNPAWPAYRKASALCEFIRDNGLADTNETYTKWVMLPLIGMIHDENALTIEQAEECFMEAVSGGARYNTMGRGPTYFRRQWRSHRPELARQGTRSLGSLFLFCRNNGMKLLRGPMLWHGNKILRDSAKSFLS